MCTKSYDLTCKNGPEDDYLLVETCSPHITLRNNKYSRADVQFFSITKRILTLRDAFIQICSKYPLTFPYFRMKYAGQTGRCFETRLKERLLPVKKNNYKFKLAQHFLETGHSFGKIYDILGFVYFDDKGKQYICKETVMGNQLNKKHAVTCNKISGTVLNREGHLTRALHYNSLPLHRSSRQQ